MLLAQLSQVKMTATSHLNNVLGGKVPVTCGRFLFVSSLCCPNTSQILKKNTATGTVPESKDVGQLLVQRCFTSTETMRLIIGTGSPGQPPPLSHSS